MNDRLAPGEDPDPASSARVRRVSTQPPDRDEEHRPAWLAPAFAGAAALAGAAAVVHAGAAMSGDADRNRGSTIVGTQNVLAAAQRHGCKRLVHISSLSVVDWAGNDRGGPMTEDIGDEPHAELRGVYTQSKLEAERLVRAAAASRKVDAVILRPGQIWGGAGQWAYGIDTLDAKMWSKRVACRPTMR